MSGQEIGLITLQTIILAVMLFGLIGMIVPVIPGLVIIWVAALLYGLVTGFANWMIIAIMVVITLLMIFGSLVDNIIMGASARKVGASWLSVAVATVAGLVGSFLLPPLGGILFALVGIFVVELIRARNLKQALGSTKSMAVGCGWSTMARFGLGLLMILLWTGWALWLTPVQ